MSVDFDGNGDGEGGRSVGWLMVVVVMMMVIAATICRSWHAKYRRMPTIHFKIPANNKLRILNCKFIFVDFIKPICIYIYMSDDVTLYTNTPNRN